MDKNKEFRSSNWEAGESNKISGYALVFEQRTVLYSDPLTGYEYGEIIDKNALMDADLSDVVLRYDHQGRVLARTRNNSLSLSVDEHGLFISADMSGSEEARSLYEDVKSGLVDKMSFAFVAAGEEWDETTRTRRITKISRLYDVSLVSFPAYEQTEVFARNQFEARAEADRNEYRAAETRSILADIESRMRKYDSVQNAEPEDFMTREEVKKAKERNAALPLIARKRIDERDPIYREMLEIRSQWESTVGKHDVKRAKDNLRRFAELEVELRGIIEKRRKDAAAVANGNGQTIEKAPKETRGKREKMDNIELRAFQKYISTGTMKNLTTEERAGLKTSGAGAVMPVEIFSQMIRNEKYSDLLSRANVMYITGAGTVKVPIASTNTATWKTELEAVGADAPTLSSLDLAGKELMRAIQYSAAVEHMTAEQFTSWMSDTCAAEVVETLESTFITGSEGTAPHNGLQHLTWTPNTNEVEVSGSITAADVAKGLSLLPQKYARNAILLMNANTAYNTVGLFKGTNEYAYSMTDGASHFMKKEINISEYCADNEIYIVDPKQLYVRFAMNPVIEVDRSVGFLSAANTMRCLTVVDFAWNPSACVRVGVSA